MEGNVYFSSEIGVCPDYIHEGVKQEAAIVISPLKVTEDETKKKRVMWLASGCSRWKACENPTCQFSLIARPPEKRAKP
jgi:hypothetical protein